MTQAIQVSLHGQRLGISADNNLVTPFGTISPQTGTATATAGAATLAKASGKITSEALTTAAGALYTLTITNTEVAAVDIILASVAYGTSTTGVPVVTRATATANTITIVIQNIHASAALNGTIVVSFFLVKV